MDLVHHYFWYEIDMQIILMWLAYYLVIVTHFFSFRFFFFMCIIFHCHFCSLILGSLIVDFAILVVFVISFSLWDAIAVLIVILVVFCAFIFKLYDNINFYYYFSSL
ncbi:hypothetical protein R6Q59_035756 [Mikania micrantha]